MRQTENFKTEKIPLQKQGRGMEITDQLQKIHVLPCNDTTREKNPSIPTPLMERDRMAFCPKLGLPALLEVARPNSESDSSSW